jgi:hypothetical protein
MVVTDINYSIYVPNRGKDRRSKWEPNIYATLNIYEAHGIVNIHEVLSHPSTGDSLFVPLYPLPKTCR